MDHVIERIQTHLVIELCELASEFKSENYPKLSECPNYLACKAMVDSIHVLEKYYYGEHKTLSVSKWISYFD